MNNVWFSRCFMKNIPGRHSSSVAGITMSVSSRNKIKMPGSLDSVTFCDMNCQLDPRWKRLSKVTQIGSTARILGSFLCFWACLTVPTHYSGWYFTRVGVPWYDALLLLLVANQPIRFGSLPCLLLKPVPLFLSVCLYPRISLFLFPFSLL